MYVCIYMCMCFMVLRTKPRNLLQCKAQHWWAPPTAQFNYTYLLFVCVHARHVCVVTLRGQKRELEWPHRCLEPNSGPRAAEAPLTTEWLSGHPPTLIDLHFLFLYLSLCMCACVCLWQCVCGNPRKPEEGMEPPGTGVHVIVTLAELGAGSQTQVL